MDILPTGSAFNTAYKAGKPQLVWTVMTSDMLTPVAAMRKLMSSSPYHLFFESVAGGATRGRYSIIALDPDIVWRCRDGTPELSANGARYKQDGTDVFASLRRLLSASRIDMPPELPSMASGLFGYMGYDMVHHMERLPNANPDTLGIPQSIYIRPRITAIFDGVKDEALLVTPVWPDKKTRAEDAYRKAEKRLRAIWKRLHGDMPASPPAPPLHPGKFRSHVSKKGYCAMVEKAKEYIRAGDIFQVVPSRRLSRPFGLPPFAFYRALRQLNPSPYLFYAAMDGFVLAGSSPEILVRVKDGTITIRPLAGTRRRGKTPAKDKALEKELLSDAKELAEHLMLLDLGRNDAGRTAAPGSVRVTEQMIIERYSHVMHIVSNVEGNMQPGCDALDALIGGFPAGTVSGAPKIRAMEIIDELEKERRSFYGGTVGYFSAGGDMDTCIALRTGLIKDKILYVQAGGGVVADSEPESEFKETQNKANALIRAAERAGKFA